MGKIRYNIYESPNTTNGQKRFHVRPANIVTREFEEIKEDLCEASTVTKADVTAVVEGLAGYLIRHLALGERIHIKGFGLFSPSLYTPSFNNRKDLKSQNIRLRGVIFEPDSELKKGLSKQEIQFELGSGLHSKTYSDKEIYCFLKEFFENHETMSLKEFQHAMGITHSTAYRRIKKLCSIPIPAIRKIGPRNSTTYVVNEAGKWRLE